MASKVYQQELPSQIHGLGIFALRFIPRGSRIHIPNRGMIRGFNHSCNANVGNAGRHCKALRDIQLGEELTKDYESGFAYAILRKGPCGCPVCRVDPFTNNGGATT